MSGWLAHDPGVSGLDGESKRRHRVGEQIEPEDLQRQQWRR